MSNSQWIVEALLPGSWRNASSVLLSNGNRHLIVDTGMPHEAHQLVQALERRGLKTSDIEAVINTHFHIDHVLNNSLFAKSIIYGTQESHDWCCSLYSDLFNDQQWEKLILKYYPETPEYDHAADYMHQLRKLTLRWWDRKRLGAASKYRWLESHSPPDGLMLFPTSGHVPGHVSVIVPGPEFNTVVAGDACLCRTEDARVLTMIPRDRRQSQRDRQSVLKLGRRIIPGHDVEFMHEGNQAGTLLPSGSTVRR